MYSRFKIFLKKYKYITAVILVLCILYYFSLPRKLFKDPTCTVIEDRSGNLLGAKIADDNQWRFPYNENVPYKFEKAILQFEDKYFFYHPGVNPVSLTKALIRDIKAGRIINGGSTVTMQVIRISRKGKPRNVLEKIKEIILATRLELRCSKKEILALYASNAPFGSNVVGLDAAAWRYFGRPPDKLSWAETATLAVLPNSPSLIYPGKNQKKLLLKRNRLLDKLYRKGIIDAATCRLSKYEELPGTPLRLPQEAPHLLTRVFKKYKGERITTTLDGTLQRLVSEIIENHHKILKYNDINNAAAIIIEVETGNVMAYVGNTQNPGNPEYGSDVDVITAPRSTGSILKPILYAAMLDDGKILPNTLIPDIPIQISGYSPQNYNLTYDGVVPARRSLSRSLNVPVVKMLQDYSVDRFYYLLQKLGMSTITYPCEHYGLSIILGGAEGCLWDITGIYAGFSRILNHFTRYSGTYFQNDMRKPDFIYKKDGTGNSWNEKLEKGILGAASIWLAYEAMVEVNRPDMEANWMSYSSSGKIAWKTGTSYGNRDAWAIGTTPRYVVGVWVGNADGEGRPTLTGIGAAAPVLFDIFGILPKSEWFRQPYDDMSRIAVCRQSGYRAGNICELVDTMWVQKAGLKTSACPYHYIVHLDKSGKYRVTSDCENVSNMLHVPWFILPPVQEWYYKSKDPGYKTLPPYRDDCISTENYKSMDLIYPKQATQIYIPLELDGNRGEVVFEAAHRNPDATIYWHIDEKFIGTTKSIHQMGTKIEKGKHLLTLVDENGETLYKTFEIVEKNK